MNIKEQFKHFLQDSHLEEYGEDYYNLATCIRSGQVSSSQVQEHLQDEDFKEYYMKYFFGTHIRQSYNTFQLHKHTTNSD
jgi:hypothetical protein